MIKWSRGKGLFGTLMMMQSLNFIFFSIVCFQSCDVAGQQLRKKPSIIRFQIACVAVTYPPLVRRAMPGSGNNRVMLYQFPNISQGLCHLGRLKQPGTQGQQPKPHIWHQVGLFPLQPIWSQRRKERQGQVLYRQRRRFLLLKMRPNLYRYFYGHIINW